MQLDKVPAGESVAREGKNLRPSPRHSVLNDKYPQGDSVERPPGQEEPESGALEAGRLHLLLCEELCIWHCGAHWGTSGGLVLVEEDVLLEKLEDRKQS